MENMKKDREQLSLDVQRLQRDHRQYRTRAAEQQKASDERVCVRVSGLEDLTSDREKIVHTAGEEVKETRAKAERSRMHKAAMTPSCVLPRKILDKYGLEAHTFLLEEVEFRVMVVADAAVQVEDVDCVEVADINKWHLRRTTRRHTNKHAARLKRQGKLCEGMQFLSSLSLCECCVTCTV